MHVNRSVIFFLLTIFSLLLAFFSLIEGVFIHLFGSVRNLEGQHGLGTVHHEDRLHLQFDIFLAARFHGDFGCSDGGFDVHYTFIRDVLNEFDHLFGNSFILTSHTLNRVKGISQNQEGDGSFHTTIVHTSTNSD